MIDVLEAAAEESQRVVERILEDRMGKVTEEMTSGEFEKLLEGDERLVDIDYAIIKACFEKVSPFLLVSMYALAEPLYFVGKAPYPCSEECEGG